MLRVLLISPLPPPRGGIATWTEMILAEARSDPQIDLNVVDISPRWRKLHQMEMWRRALGGGRQIVRDLSRILRVIWQQRPSVIHLCTSGQLAFLRDVLVLSLARRLGVRTVYHLRFGRIPELIKRSAGWEWLMARWALQLASIVIALDERTLSAIQEHFPCKHVVKLPNCIDPAKLEQPAHSPVASDRKPGLNRATYVGWVIRSKGVLEMVQAASRVGQSIPFQMELIGPGDPDYLIEVRKAGASLEDRLLIRGEWPHARAIEAMRQTDLLVLPSYTEGFPNVVMEAMALGKPVIATDVGAIPEMLRDENGGECGIVVPSKDVDALERALRMALPSEKWREHMGLKAKALFMSRYTKSVVYERLKAIWAFPSEG